MYFQREEEVSDQLVDIDCCEGSSCQANVES